MTSVQTPTVIEHWPLDRLVPCERNARTHSCAQIDQIAASISEFGFTNPILVDCQARVLAGHARLLAARHLQLELVPVIVLAHLNELQKRAYMLADNKLTLNAGWDKDLLAQKLAALDGADFHLTPTGFDEELGRLLAKSAGLEDKTPGLQNQDHPFQSRHACILRWARLVPLPRSPDSLVSM